MLSVITLLNSNKFQKKTYICKKLPRIDMKYFVLIFAYLLSMAHTFVPHHHHDILDNLGHVSVDSDSFHDHQHDHHHHKSNQHNSDDHGKSESPYSHLLSPIDGSVYLENQSGISVQKNSHTDINAVLTAAVFLYPSRPIVRESAVHILEPIYNDPPAGACDLRGPPIC